MFVGVFPMNRAFEHVLAAATFFNLGWIAVALASLTFVRLRDPRFPGWLAWSERRRSRASSRSSCRSERTRSWPAASRRPATGRALDRAALEWAVIAAILAWTFLVGICWRRALRAEA